MIFQEIKNHIDSSNFSYDQWYVGIASNPRERLFTGHNVCKETGRWIFRNAKTETEARSIEKNLLNLGCQGGSGGGNLSTTSVYAYLTTTTTIE